MSVSDGLWGVTDHDVRVPNSDVSTGMGKGRTVTAQDGGHNIGALARKLASRSEQRGADRDVVDLAAEAKRLHRALRDLLAQDGRDTDEIPGFSEMADDLADLAERVCGSEASGLAGLVAKAELIVEFRSSASDSAEKVALSMARDLLAIADAGDA